MFIELDGSKTPGSWTAGFLSPPPMSSSRLLSHSSPATPTVHSTASASSSPLLSGTDDCTGPCEDPRGGDIGSKLPGKGGWVEAEGQR